MGSGPGLCSACLKAIAMDAAGMAMSSCKKLISWLGSVDGIMIFIEILPI
jgi:hypothetical protein